MWTCPNCQNENEENFKFCWSCGQTRAKAEVSEIKAEVPAAKAEISAEPPPPVTYETVEEVPKPKEKPPLSDNDDADVLPMLARVAGVEKKETLADEDVSLERKVFTIAVRLVGLLLLYQVLIAFPDWFWSVYAAVTRETTGDASVTELFEPGFFVRTANLLFYLIVGIYLIASGRILLWLLPRR